MKKQLTKEEQLIEYFIQKYENKKSLDISIGCKDAENLNMSEEEVIQYITIMSDKNWLQINKKSVHNNLNIPCNIHLDPICLDYFKNKQVHKKQTRREFWVEFRAWLTLIIALIALIHSIFTADSKNVSSQTSLHGLPESVSSLSDNQVLNP